MRVNCNISAVIANNQLGKSENSLDKAIERLSSGLRINHAEDDAAGMAISKKMHAQIKALEQSGRNTSDGISVVQTAESALGEIENMLQRMRELAVQSADDTYSAEDKDAIQAEVSQLVDEIDRVSTDTEFNTMPLLNGSLSRRVYSDTTGVNMIAMSSSVSSGDYSFTVSSPGTQARLTADIFSETVTEAQAGKMTINGAEVTISAGQTFTEVYDNMMEACNRAGVTLEKTGSFLHFTNNECGKFEEVNIEFDSETTAKELFGLDKINTEYGSDAEVKKGAGFSDSASVTTEGNKVTIKDINNFSMEFEIGKDSYGDCKFKVTDMGTMGIQVGTNDGQQISIDIPKINAHTLGIDSVNIGTSYTASRSLDKLDEAITKVSSARSSLGAYQNRLETTVESIASYNENITSALSRIEDCDMATEMTEYTSQNVISQAATSVLSQANERPQTVLQLLQ